MKYLYLFLFLLPLTSWAQKDHFIIKEVIIQGNKRTKNKIIERELDLFPGTRVNISEIKERFELNERRVLSTGLFTHIQINIDDWDTTEGKASIVIDLQENWYIYPAPIFELADRNFNVWWNEQGKSLSRVNYGVRLSHINLSGLRDKLKLVAQFGYTRKLEADYSFPYLNEKQTWGIRSNIFYSENKEIGYITKNNKTEFWKEDDERVMLRRFRLRTQINYRPDLFSNHTIGLDFHRNSVDDIVSSELNPNYFLGGESAIRFFKIEYDYKYDKREFTLYPEGGYRLGGNIRKEGLGIFKEYNNLILTLQAENYQKISDKLILATSAKARTNINRSEIAFANNTALGYGRNIVRGYELYVVDGTDSFLSRNSLRWKAIDKLINLGSAMPLREFRFMMLKVFLTANFDFGYVNEPKYIETNFLNNRWIYGYGPGLDIVLLNTYLIQIEYSFNHLGENALYLSNRVSF